MYAASKKALTALFFLSLDFKMDEMPRHKHLREHDSGSLAFLSSCRGGVPETTRDFSQASLSIDVFPEQRSQFI